MKKILSLTMILGLLMGCQSTPTKTISLNEAKEIALAEEHGEVIRSAEEKEDGKTYYEFLIVNDSGAYEIEIDAHQAKLVKKEKDDDYRLPNKQQEMITKEKAQQIALDKVGTGNIVSFDYDEENSQYEIEIRDGHKEYELDIDAYGGTIVSYHEDYDD